MKLAVEWVIFLYGVYTGGRSACKDGRDELAAESWGLASTGELARQQQALVYSCMTVDLHVLLWVIGTINLNCILT